MSSVYRVISVIECIEERKLTERKQFQVAFCASLFIQKCFRQLWIFSSTFLLSIADQLFNSLLFKRSERGGEGKGKKIWFILIWVTGFPQSFQCQSHCFPDLKMHILGLFHRQIFFYQIPRALQSLYKTQFNKNS